MTVSLVKRCSWLRQLGVVGWTRVDRFLSWVTTWRTGSAVAPGCLLGALLLVVASSGPVSGAVVRDITLLPHDQGVRVVIDLGEKVPFQHQTFDGPPRLVVDLPNVSWQLPERRGTRAYRMVRGFRFGKQANGVSRLIVDMDRPFKIETVFELPPTDSSGYRIVTDLAPLPPHVTMRNQSVRSTSYEAALARPEVVPAPKRRPVADQQIESAVPTQNRTAQKDQVAGDRIASENAVPIPAPRPSALVPKRMIVIDPGHGGIDPGASGQRGTYEKNVVLSMALELRRHLVDSGRYDVILTRGDDSFIRLRDRLQIARASGGHLFLSLHADSLANDTDVRGAAVYTLSDQASSEEAERLASVENRSDILGGIDLSHHEPLVTQILIDLAQRDANSKSLKIADLMVTELGDVTKLLRKQRQQAGFVVLKSPDMPSALIELGYLSNRKDEVRLTNQDHIVDLAKAMVRAIDRYFGAPPS
ncbi:MAG: N-acetylmuramoyl-L-alanine amidase [Geminicoccaceae bacterium]